MLQKTLKEKVEIRGVGLHTGYESHVVLNPAPENFGIKLVRSDISDSPNEIPVSYKNVAPSIRCTALRNESNVKVLTIEHLLASIYGLEISNIQIDVYGEEIPILDGSALPYVEFIKSAGIREQNSPKKRLYVQKEITVNNGDRWAVISPSDTFNINITCDYLHKGLITDRFHYTKDIDFEKYIAPARTFGFYEDVEYMREHNIANGGSLKNAVIFNYDGEALNMGGLRFPDEPMRHKVLDMLGDLMLSGYEIVASIEAFQHGHELVHKLLDELFSDSSNYEIKN